jgi:hypothetical protein
VYAGLNFGMDGYTLVGGMKLAGVKIMVPFSSIDQDQFMMESPLLCHILVAGGFFYGAYKLYTNSLKRRKAAIEEWIAKDCQALYGRNLIVQEMIESRAKINQSKSQLKVRAAYYGSKMALQDFINEKLRSNEPLESSDQFMARPFISVPKFVIDVTLAVQF